MTAIQVPQRRQFSSGKILRLGGLLAIIAGIGAVWMLQPGRAATLAKAELPEAITGQASVVDGDTIDIRGERIRLDGIDAPESGQRCYSSSHKLYRCGANAANALDQWIGTASVTCRIDGTDRYKRLLGTCEVRGDNMQAWMVENGHAIAYRQYSTQYVEAEHRASAARAGVWQGEFVEPQLWRQGLRMEGEKPTKAMREGKFGLAGLSR